MIKHSDGITDFDAEILEASLKRVVAHFPGEAIHVLEIGLHTGDTARGIKAWFEEAKIPLEYWIVDNGSHAGMHAPFPDAHMTWGDSGDVYSLVPSPLHWIFIDGCHCVNHTMIDFLNYGEKVPFQGEICFHDTMPDEPHKHYQGHGPKNNPDFLIACREGVERLGLYRGRLKDWLLLKDAWVKGSFGGVTVVQKIG